MNGTPPPMLTLALDCSLRNTGYAVFVEDILEEWGLITTKKIPGIGETESRIRNVSYIVSELSGMANLSTRVVMEFPTGTQSATAAISMYLAIGSVIGLAKGKNIDSYAIFPRTAKAAILWNSNATKEDVMAWAIRTHPDRGFPRAKTKFEHIADAILIFHASRVPHIKMVKI